jgi:hypothetical protein
MSSTKIYEGGGVGQSVQYLVTDWTTGFRSPAKATKFSSSACVQASSEALLASYPKGTGGSFPRVNALLGRDADHSPPSSVKVNNE